MTARTIACHRARPALRRAIGVGLAALVVFAQVAAAADRCLLERLSGEQASHAAAAVDHSSGAIPEAHCATDPDRDSQAPGTEPKRDAFDLDPGAPLAVRWDAAPRVEFRIAQRDAPGTGPPRTLQFHSLRL